MGHTVSVTPLSPEAKARRRSPIDVGPFSRTVPLYFLFLCSGVSGLIYQVVWVRVFGNVFGNTVYSASLVIAVFMVGLGVGSYLVGVWADRRYLGQQSLPRRSSSDRASEGGSLPRRSSFDRTSEGGLRAYGYVELLIAVLGLGISLLLPHLGQVSAFASSYVRDTVGWHVLSTGSYLSRVAIAVVLLTPITLLMGGTLTLLVRHLVRRDFEIGHQRIALLYGVNTAGAALGCFLTDFSLVPLAGLFGTQMVAVFFNVVAGLGALYLSRVPSQALQAQRGRRQPQGRDASPRRPSPELSPEASEVRAGSLSPAVVYTSVALALCGFAAMGMEILWFRHFSILLGQFRAVFSLLLTVILIGIGAGAFASTVLFRRALRPAHWLMVVQGLFVASTLIGLAMADVNAIDNAGAGSDPASLGRAAAAAALGAGSGWTRAFMELWFNAKPMLLEVLVPALLMGFSFPLANGIIQRAEDAVGRRAGILYLSNTVGAVCGSLVAGFVLLPTLGIQGSATILMVAAGLAIVPLYLVDPLRMSAQPSSGRPALASSTLVVGLALGLWLILPSNYLIARALPRPTEHEQLLTLSEGLTEIIAISEVSGKGRRLLTNGHPMSSTARLSQRYMRALAHIPLLSIDHPKTALVIGFGVGNTTHAATLHPSIERVEVADLSRHVLEHSSYFSEVHGNVLDDPRVVVYVNDGRHHLQMQPAASYDLITLEPPPIGYAGVAALYSKEFYALARTRLTPNGYLSQWLPANQVPTSTTLAMVKAFIDVFPQSVLISGAEADLLLIGTNESKIEVDPARLEATLMNAPLAQADLRRLDLGTVREIVGSFVGSARQLAEATRSTSPVTDDRPIQEYGVRSLLNLGESVPASIVDLSELGAWCPKCFVDGQPAPAVQGLDTYLALLSQAYAASPSDVIRARTLAEEQGRLVAGSAYLGAIVPESADLHNALGIALADQAKFDEAVVEFRQALSLEPDSARTHWHLGAALASRGSSDEAIEHLRRSVALDPTHAQAAFDLASVLLRAGQFESAAEHFRASLRLMPNSVDAYNSLGIALASLGKLDEAIEQFQQALKIDPESTVSERNLALALRQAGPLDRHRKRP